MNNLVMALLKKITKFANIIVIVAQLCTFNVGIMNFNSNNCVLINAIYNIFEYDETIKHNSSGCGINGGNFFHPKSNEFMFSCSKTMKQLEKQHNCG